MFTPREDLSSDRILLVAPTVIRLVGIEGNGQVGMEGKPTAVVSPCTRVEFPKPGPDSSVSHARPTATPLPRGYATTAAAAAATTTTGTGSRERLAVAEQMVKSAPPAGAEEAACSWVPDPATGYYRPANRMDEIDPAALREMLLTRNKSRSRLI
ncbi:hypothetical protein GW17_00030279 [Ensete ventricosum]|nr:hypothetical protein GW17_00030279 [Ensete ventricosum]RZS10334.1 hypothetical protein BHM03_00041548 [Ensete ventricosum]